MEFGKRWEAKTSSGAHILAIRDETGKTFGSFATSMWKISSKYFGSGETFLWQANQEEDVVAYKWTGQNDYTLIAENEFIAMGGG